MDCDCAVTTAAGVAFVGVTLRNPTPVTRRVRVENRLAGPLLPPRVEGVPESGWDQTGVSVVVRPHANRPLGYACPLDPGTDDAASDRSLADPELDDPGLADPPAAVVVDERVSESDETARRSETDESRSADDTDQRVHEVVRDLGRPAPPRDAVPAPDLGTVAESDGESDADSRPALDALDTTSDRETSADDEATDSPDAPDDHGTTDSRNTLDGSGATGGHETPADTLPPSVAAWLAEIEGRIDTAERLDPDTSVETATRRFEEVDVPPAALPARLTEDRRLLAELADRIDRLTTRAESASVPTDHLRRLS
jgi:hypothetical protein